LPQLGDIYLLATLDAPLRHKRHFPMILSALPTPLLLIEISLRFILLQTKEPQISLALRTGRGVFDQCSVFGYWTILQNGTGKIFQQKETQLFRRASLGELEEKCKEKSGAFDHSPSSGRLRA
jgi:hypothetical protein